MRRLFVLSCCLVRGESKAGFLVCFVPFLSLPLFLLSLYLFILKFLFYQWAGWWLRALLGCTGGGGEKMVGPTLWWRWRRGARHLGVHSDADTSLSLLACEIIGASRVWVWECLVQIHFCGIWLDYSELVSHFFFCNLYSLLFGPTILY